MYKQLWRTLLGLTMCMTLSGGTAIAQVNLFYNPDLGTLPEAQGFTRYEESGFPATVVGGGVLHTFAQTVPAATQYWYNNSSPLDFSTTSYSLEATLYVISSNYIFPLGDGTQRSGYYLWAIDAAGRSVAVGIASDGITINTDAGFAPDNGVPFTSFNTTDTFHTYHLLIANGVVSLFIDGTLFATTPVGGAVIPSEANYVRFGDATGLGVSEIELRLFQFQQAEEAVGGSVRGFRPRRARCINRTTGQSVVIELAGTPSWDCEAAGLVVNPGDRIHIGVNGRVE